MAIISNGTTVASGGTVRGSASNLTSIPAPTNSQILSGVASASAGAVGSYAFVYRDFWQDANEGTTLSSDLHFSNADSRDTRNITSGTWRVMGAFESGSAGRMTSVMLRIS